MSEAPGIATYNGVSGVMPSDQARPMTEKQAAELRQLCKAADLPFDTSLNRQQAARRIATLKEAQD